MPADDDAPAYACRCLNIRLCEYKGNNEDAKRQSQQDSSTAEYPSLYVGDEGIKISHNELTLRTRSRVVADSTSTTGRTQQTLVTCLVCDTAAYHVKAEVPPDEDAKEGPVLPTEDWVERDTLTSKSGYVDVHVGKEGCITQDEIKRLLSSSSYSQYFALAMPSESHVLSTTAPPLLPQARLTVPASHSFLPNLPPFLPPPPFTSSHPIFLHLSSIVTATSNDARRDTEKRIEDFTRRELSRLEERETNLRMQLERIWWIVKEGLKKAEQERDASLLLSLKSRRRSMSPHHLPLSAGEAGSLVVRNFVPSATYHTPRAIHSSAPRPSALSTSLATTSFHHPRAQEDAKSDADDARGRRAPLTPSPPPYTSNPSSSKSGSESPTDPMVIASRSFKRNMDETNDAAATYRFFVIEEQEAARRKAKEQAEKNRSNEVTREKIVPNPGSEKQPPGQTPQAEEKTDTVAPANDKVTSPKKKDGRRKVTFNIEPNIVTIKRDITAEAEEEQLPEKGEDLLFDMDGIDLTPVNREDQAPSDVIQGVQEIPSETNVELVPHEPVEQVQRPNRRIKDLKNAGLPESFAALRPSSLPAPSHIRPPIRFRTRSDDNEVKQSSTERAGSSSSQPKDIKRRQSSEENIAEGVLSPEQKDFLKLVAAETPSHRGLWKPGSEAWRIFDRGSSSSGKHSPDEAEDDVDDPSASNANGRTKDSIDSDWRQYRRSDIVGSLPIPMAPISQQRPAGSLSLRPKTSLTDRPGTLVPPLPSLPVVAEEEEEGKEKGSAATIRKRVYAERNKARGLDPGILDFADDGDDEGEGASPEPEDPVDQVSASRSRQHALNIIRIRNSVPPEGLWRSLAT